jgi:hypothetical protein
VVAARSRLDLTWRVRLTRTAALAMMLLGAAVAFAALRP